MSPYHSLAKPATLRSGQNYQDVVRSFAFGYQPLRPPDPERAILARQEDCVAVMKPLGLTT